MTRRNNLDICADILRIAGENGGVRKTRIVYLANLNFKIVKKYLRDLIENGLLQHLGDFYFITDKGRTFIRRYRGLGGMM